MAISSKHRSQFAALQRKRWGPQKSDKFPSGTKNSKVYKETNKLTLIGICQIFMHSEKQKNKKKSDLNLVVLILSAE